MLAFHDTACKPKFASAPFERIIQHLQSVLRAAEVPDLESEFIQRVSGNVDANDFAFPRQQVHLIPGVAHGNGGFRHFHFFHSSKEGCLRTVFVFLVTCTVTSGQLDERPPLLIQCKVLRPMQSFKAIKSTAQGQCFENTLVHVFG